MDGRRGCCHPLAVVTRAAVNTVVLISVQVPAVGLFGDVL